MMRGFLAGVLAGAVLAAFPNSISAQCAGAKQADTKMSAGAQSLGSVRLTRSVKANGEVLKPGTYQIRLTDEAAKPPAPGATQSFERWVEFLQSGQVKGREVVSIVPDTEIAQVAESKRVQRGSYRVEMLKGNEFVRVWISRGGNNYLIHMPPA